MSQYDRADVVAVANAVVERAYSHDESGKNAYSFCRYCRHRAMISWQDGGTDEAERHINHAPDCVYLVAKDLLT